MEANGVVRYNVDLSKLPGAETQKETGRTLANGTCRFSAGDEGQAGASGHVLVITEVSYNPSTCSRKVARAEYPRDDLPRSVERKLNEQAPHTESKSDSSRTALGTDRSRVAANSTAAAGPWSGSLKVNVEDPPQIDVTTTKSYLTWSTDDVYLYSDHESEWGWFTGSGWENKEQAHTFDNNGSWASTDTYGKYRNGVFCLTIDTWTEHKKTYFEGWYDGYWAWEYEVDKSGGCTDLLHYEYIAETP